MTRYRFFLNQQCQYTYMSEPACCTPPLPDLLVGLVTCMFWPTHKNLPSVYVVTCDRFMLNCFTQAVCKILPCLPSCPWGKLDCLGVLLALLPISVSTKCVFLMPMMYNFHLTYIVWVSVRRKTNSEARCTHTLMKSFTQNVIMLSTFWNN